MGSDSPTVIHRTANCVVASQPVNAFGMNQYLIGCTATNQAFLLDCGDAQVDKWTRFSVSTTDGKPTKLSPFSIKGIFQTHCHLDHIAGLQATIKALKSSTPIYYHQGDAVWLKDPFHSFGGAGSLFPTIKPPVEIPAEQERKVTEGDKISVGNLEFEVFHVPGHTPGQVFFYCAAEKIVFVGDLIFQGSVGRSDLAFSDRALMHKSLERAISVLPNDVTIFSGHGDKTTMGAEKQTNPHLRPLVKSSKL